MCLTTFLVLIDCTCKDFQQLSSGLERNQIGIPGIMEVAIQLPALRITTSVLSKGCADINSLVAMPLCVLWGVASQL